jgi:methionyl-tRNA formyltransferase
MEIFLKSFNSFSLILASNNRAKCYFQNLLKRGFVPNEVVFVDVGNELRPENTINDSLSINTEQVSLVSSDVLSVEFDEKEHVLKTAKKHNINLIQISTSSVNDKAVVDVLKSLDTRNFVYAGPGGEIISREILEIKSVFHVHPGYLPTYRGSTTIYYSMIAQKSVGCSVIEFSSKIDQGPLYYRQNYPIDMSVDLDYHYDPMVRTKCLIEFFDKNFLGQISPVEEESRSEALDFYIIHPFLKHVALSRVCDEE